MQKTSQPACCLLTFILRLAQQLFVPIVVILLNKQGTSIVQFMLLVPFSLVKSPRINMNARFKISIGHLAGPKTVKLFANKEHMGFRYALLWFQINPLCVFFLKKITWQSLTICGLSHLFFWSFNNSCSNVNDYPPSDSITLSLENLKVKFCQISSLFILLWLRLHCYLCNDANYLFPLIFYC